MSTFIHAKKKIIREIVRLLFSTGPNAIKFRIRRVASKENKSHCHNPVLAFCTCKVCVYYGM